VSQAITTTRQQQYGHNSNISGNSNTQSEDTYSSSNIKSGRSSSSQNTTATPRVQITAAAAIEMKQPQHSSKINSQSSNIFSIKKLQYYV